MIKICLFGGFYDMYISTSIGGHNWRYDAIDASYNIAMVVLFESQILESGHDERWRVTAVGCARRAYKFLRDYKSCTVAENAL